MSYHRNAEQWRTIFSEFHQSGLSITAYCQQQRIAASNFYAWRKKLGVAIQQITSNASDWHAVAPVAPLVTPVAEPSWDLELTLPGGTVLKLRH